MASQTWDFFETGDHVCIAEEFPCNKYEALAARETLVEIQINKFSCSKCLLSTFHNMKLIVLYSKACATCKVHRQPLKGRDKK